MIIGNTRRTLAAVLLLAAGALAAGSPARAQGFADDFAATPPVETEAEELSAAGKTPPGQPEAATPGAAAEGARQGAAPAGATTAGHAIGDMIRSGGRATAEQGRRLWQEALLPALQRTAAAVPSVLKALLLLLAFWIAGRLAGACVRRLLDLTRIDDRAVRDWGLEGLLKRPDGSMRSLAALLGGAVKWLLLLFGFVAFFNALDLALVASPLQRVLDRIIGVIPCLLEAAVILLIYWIIAALARVAVTRSLGALKFDQRAGRHLGADAAKTAEAAPSVMIGRLVFYVVLLFGVPPFLQALGQQALVGPLQNMLSKALGVLPNLVAAAIILMVGRIVASIVREVVGNLLAAGGVDKSAEKLGVGKMLGTVKVSDIVAKIAYFLILIPILIAAVDSLGIKAISDPLKATLQNILDAVPALLLATVIVIVGWVVARIARSLVETFLAGVGFDALPGRLGLDFLSPKSGQMTLSGVTGAAAAVVIVLITAQQAAAALRLSQLADLLRQIVEYLPSLVVGLLILLAAISVGRYVGGLVTRALEPRSDARALANIARYAVILLGAGMALEQLGVGRDIVVVAVGAVLGGAALALGLAFGLGGKERAREAVERWGRPGPGA